MKTAVIYARYSSNSQTEQSIEGQLRVCNEYANQHDILILGTYIDRAMTGTNDKRPEFQRMIAESYKKEWNYVLVYKLDRFSRNKYETAIHEHSLNINNVKLISATEHIPDAPVGVMMKGFIENMNQYYSAELAEKVRRGMRETREKGLFQGGALAFGYKVENRKIIIDEENANIVRFIFNQYNSGMYATDIVNILNEKGIKIKGKIFIKNTLYKILRNEKYTGIYRYKDEVFENMYPKIIDAEIFNNVQLKFKKNKYGRKSEKTNYLLRKKLTCGYCGKSINGECGTAKSGKVIHYYKCFTVKNHKKHCEKVPIRKDMLEKIIIDLLIKVLSKSIYKNKVVEELLKRQSLNKENVILQVLEKEYKKNKTSLNNLIDAIEHGIYSQSTNSRLHELENAINELEKQILIEKSKSDIKLSKNDIERFYENALNYESQILVNYLIREIKLYNDRIEIYLNSPIKKGSDSQDFSFYFTAIYNFEIEIYV